jgi:hypothetical protein
MPTREYAVRVKGMRRRPVDEVSKVAGNFMFGFPNRRQMDDPVRFEKTTDGTGLKKGRKSVVRKKKNCSRLVSTFQVKVGAMHPEDREEWQNSFKKRVRKANRNRRASRGRK